MSPFSSAVWIYLGISYVTVSICFFCLGRVSPSQWENRLPCVEGLHLNVILNAKSIVNDWICFLLHCRA